MEELLARLDRAIAAAAILGLPREDATAVRDAVAQRSGYPGELYVLALAGGTGVGKSSLLNSLAGATLSTVGYQRPTTTGAIAWVPAHHVDEAAPLLDWLGGAELRVHDGATGPGPVPVAVLDLPDLDSVEPDHAARVDAVLPKVDAVAWVSDPEKYADAVLHDRYLRRWAPRLGRQAFVLNKTDRLDAPAADRIRGDIRERLMTTGAASGPGMPVLLVSALGDAAELRDWLADGVEAREVVRRRLERSAGVALADLAGAAGLDPATPPRPLVTAARREAAVAATTDAVLRVVDLEGLRRQAVEATLDAARGRGGGPLGRLRAILDRGSGRRERAADPQGYLIRWHDRGDLVPATIPIRRLVSDVLPDLPAPARAGVALLADGDGLAARLATATDRAIAGPAGRFQTPRGWSWSLIGMGQLLATAALIVGVVWLIAAFVTHSLLPAGSLDIPLLGPMPTPAVLIIAGLFGSWLLSRVLAADARRLGRGWASALATDVRGEVDTAVAIEVSARLQTWDDARTDLWEAARVNA